MELGPLWIDRFLFAAATEDAYLDSSDLVYHRWVRATPLFAHPAPRCIRTTLLLDVLRSNVDGDHKAVGSFVLKRLVPDAIGFYLIGHENKAFIPGGAKVS